MGQTTYANGRGIAHEGSDGMSVVYPNVCNTPSSTGTITIPYPNIGEASDTSDGPSTVKCDGEMPMVKGATYSESSGDDGGSSGGVISGVNGDVAEFMMYSFDVKFDDKNVCRLGDPLYHNDQNTMG